MADWLDHSLSDFLLFSPATYWRLFEQLNAAVWPLHPVLLGGLVVVAGAAAFGRRWAGSAMGVGLAVAWALVASLFFATYYQPVNWAVAWVTPCAWAQAALVLALAPGLRFDDGGKARWLAVGLVALALAYPLVGVVGGRPLIQSEFAGLAPDPSALLSLGLAGLARRSWRQLALGVLPAIWLCLSAATLFAMEEMTAWVLLAGLVVTAFMLGRRA